MPNAGTAVACISAVRLPVTSRAIRKAEGFTLIELLIVVAVIAILAAITVPGLIRARISGNEASAIGSMRAIASGQATYSSSCGGGGYAVALDDLGMAPFGGVPFIPPDLAAAFPGGTPKSGYEFEITPDAAGAVVLLSGDTCNGSGNDTETAFFATAAPIDTTTGTRFFGLNQTGNFRQDTAALGDITDGIPLQ